MEIKLVEIKAMMESLFKISKQNLPVRISYKISKLIKKLSDEWNFFEGHRQQLIKKYCNEENKEKIDDISPVKKEEFYTELNDLLEEGVEVDFALIKLSEIEQISLSPLDMIRLEKIIVDE